MAVIAALLSNCSENQYPEGMLSRFGLIRRFLSYLKGSFDFDLNCLFLCFQFVCGKCSRLSRISILKAIVSEIVFMLFL